jgi:hypothetical protein
MLRSALAVMLLATLGVSGHMKRMAEWELLGSRQVSERLDHDEVAVPATKGAVRRIKLVVQRAPLSLQRVVITYATGLPQRVELPIVIAADGESAAIDVAGPARTVKSVEFWYDAAALQGRRSQVRVMGLR